jgi:cystathionine gamma-synthase
MASHRPDQNADRLPAEGQRLETLAITAGRPHRVGGPVNTPITLASNYVSGAGPEYSRGDSTPTWTALEEAIGVLEGGVAIAFSSGMAAVSSVFGRLRPGAKVLLPADCYQGVAILAADGEAQQGWIVERLPTADTQRWLDALPGTDLCWLESPSNPMLDIADLPTICAAAKSLGVVTAVDNTFATPLLQQPLGLGATYSIQSATKFIGGHSDLLCGIVTAESDDAAAPIDRHRTYHGATPGALEAYLALRGLRTMPIRLERSQASAMTLAKRLAEHRQVTEVHYPGLADDPGHDLARATLAGPGAMLSFQMRGSDTSTDVRLGRLRLITPATSLGGVESLIERRAKLVGQEHIPSTLCRLSVGCEHVEDLWEDLDQALSGQMTGA